MDSPYDILGVKVSSSKEDIKKKYRQLAQKYHPDTGHQANAKRFAQVTEAYGLLKNLGFIPPKKEEKKDLPSFKKNLYKERLHPNREKQQQAFYRKQWHQAFLKIMGVTVLSGFFLALVGILTGFYSLLGLVLGLLMGALWSVQRFFDLKTFLKPGFFKGSLWGYWLSLSLGAGYVLGALLSLFF